MSNKHMLNRRQFIFKSCSIAAGTCLGASFFGATDLHAADWNTLIKSAAGQTLRFNAWGGDEKINAYIRWAGDQVAARYDISVQHVKLAETAGAIRTVLAEKSASNLSRGTIDLIWINGENFYTMKRNGLLFGPFAEQLPSFAHVDVKNKPTVVNDFGVPTDGYEAPWGMAFFTMMTDTKRVTAIPSNPTELLDYVKANPGRFTYPLPPDYTGSAFLKQLLLSLNKVGAKEYDHPNVAPLYNEITEANAQRLSFPVWEWLDELHPNAWQKGKRFPSNYPMLRHQLNNSVIDFAMAYNPNEAASAILQNLLPASVRPFTFDGGMIGNTHFVAIPFNSPNTASAQVFSNFLMSPEAQARKADIAVWGDPSVLKLSGLSSVDKAKFDTGHHEAQLPLSTEASILREPHPSWQEHLEKVWVTKYGNQ